MLAEAIRLLVILAMAVSAAYLAQRFPPAYVPKNLALILIIIIGTGLGYVIGGIVGRRIARLVNWIEEKTKKISSTELLAGMGGLIMGLIIASLIAKPIEASLKPIRLAAPYAIAMVYFILGYMGFTLFAHRGLNLELPTMKKSTQSLGLNILDTSAIIDGRIADIFKTGFTPGAILIPRFVLSELQTIADSADELRRSRGRRGLEILQDLRKQSGVDIEIIDEDFPSLNKVDDKLVKLCKEKEAALITNDYNLSKIASLEGIHVLNINELASALKPVVLPGESFSITVIKEGKEKNQGVGYLDDGTMVVVEDGIKNIGKTIEVTVNSVLQTSAGKLVFTKVK